MGHRGVQGKVKWGVVPVPTSSGKPADQIHTFSDAKNVAMYSACKNRGTAWDVLKFATSKDQDGKLLEDTGQMPMRADVARSYPDYFTKHPDYKQFAEQAARTVEVPNVPNSVTIWQTFRDAYSSSVIFGQGPVERLTAAADKIDQLQPGLTARHDHRRARASAELGPRAARPRRHPLGTLFVAPYAVFLAVVFAYPLGFAVYMSFTDYFFAAPGVKRRPAVRRVRTTTSRCFSDPAVLQSFVNVVMFLVINVPLTVVLSLVLATALNRRSACRTFLRVAYYVPYVTASVAVVGVWLFLFNADGLVNKVLGPLAPDPSWLVNCGAGHADRSRSRHLEAARLLHPALPGRAAERAEGAVRVGVRSTAPAGGSRSAVTVPGVRPATALVVLLATITGANLFTEPYLLTNGGGPDGASTSPVLLMYQRGIEQGHPGRRRRDRRHARDRRAGHRRSSAVALRNGTLSRTDPPSTDARGTLRDDRSLVLGALVFLFPFYYMVVGSFQAEPEPSLGGSFPTGGPDAAQLRPDRHARSTCCATLANSGIFTGGVLLCTWSSASSPATPWPG